ncbi:MAG: hypothetical protein IKL62_00365 [Clostridia bacterium]|nr:hypothetical protein [Clostridia bacterium]
MDNKMKKRIFAITAGVLALIILVVAIFLILNQCDGTKTAKKPPKKVVVVGGNNNNDDPSGEIDDDPFESDDISLDLGYAGGIEYETHELMGSDGENYIITVDNGSDPLCTSFRGVTSTIYHPSEYLSRDPHGRKYTEEMLDLELSRMRDSGIKFVRPMFWSNWMWTGNPDDPWDTENETMQEFYAWCKKLAEYDIQVAPMMMWSYGGLFYGGNEYLVEVDYLIPKKLDENGDPILAYDFGIYHDQTDHELQNERCADWVTTVAQAFRDHGVTNHFGFFFGNEPHEDGNLPMGAFAQWQVATFAACEKGLRDAGFRDKGSDDYVTLIGPNQSSPNHPAGLAKYFMENAPQVFDIYSSHFTKKTQSATDDPYDDASRVFNGYMETMDLFDLRFQKEFWLDEFGSNGDSYNEDADLDDPWYAVNIATQQIAAFNAGVSAIEVWQFLDQTWPDYYGSGGEYEYGAQRSGSAPSLYKTEVPWSLYYTIALFGRYSGNEGGTTYVTKALDDSSGLYATAVKLADGGWSILMVNMTTDTKTFTFNFEEELNVTLYRYLHEAGSDTPNTAASVTVADKGFKNVGKTFSDTITGGSVVVYSTMQTFSSDLD